MRILLTTTSFTDTPGEHQEKLKSLNYKVDILRGPLKEEILLPIIGNYDGIICGDDEITRSQEHHMLRGAQRHEDQKSNSHRRPTTISLDLDYGHQKNFPRLR